LLEFREISPYFALCAQFSDLKDFSLCGKWSSLGRPRETRLGASVVREYCFVSFFSGDRRSHNTFQTTFQRRIASTLPYPHPYWLTFSRRFSPRPPASSPPLKQTAQASWCRLAAGSDGGTSPPRGTSSWRCVFFFFFFLFFSSCFCCGGICWSFPPEAGLPRFFSPVHDRFCSPKLMKFFRYGWRFFCSQRATLFFVEDYFVK